MDALKDIITAISAFLDKKPLCTEHELLSELSINAVTPFDQFNIQHSKDLFSAHFLLMHALYHLQLNYLETKQYCLTIKAIKVERLDFSSGTDSLIQHDPLREYYLDIKHYFETSEAEVNDLLNTFWTKFLAQEDKQQALDTLELPADSDYPSVKKQYRLLAQQHHPDKGGCGQQFAKISAAKRILDQCYK